MGRLGWGAPGGVGGGGGGGAGGGGGHDGTVFHNDPDPLLNPAGPVSSTGQ